MLATFRRTGAPAPGALLLGLGTIFELTGAAGREPVRSVCFSPDGRLLLSASDDMAICVWDPHELKLKKARPGSPPSSQALHPPHVLRAPRGHRLFADTTFLKAVSVTARVESRTPTASCGGTARVFGRSHLRPVVNLSRPEATTVPLA
jgi:WD40 repeat protein